MQESKKVHSQSQGSSERLCCRIFHYIDNALPSRGSKHPESGDHHHKPTMEVPPGVAGSSTNADVLSESRVQSRGSNLGSEIEIELRHTENEQNMWNSGLHKGGNEKGRAGKMKQVDAEVNTTHEGAFSVTSNNGNAIEEFLRSRKEAMMRYYTMDHNKK